MEPPAPREGARATSMLAREMRSVADIIVAPARAYATIRELAPWRVAFAAQVLINVLVIALSSPALWHVVMANNPNAHKMSAAEIAQASHVFLFWQGVQAAFFPAFTAGLIALGLTVSTPRKLLENRRLVTFFSLAITSGVPHAIGDLCSAAVTALRPASSYTTFSQYVLAFPDSLAVLAPGGSDAEVIFLGNIDLFEIWSFIVIAFGYATLTGASLNRALTISFACAFALCLLVG